MIEMHGVNLAVSITRQGCNLLLQYSIPEYLFTKLPIMNISGYYNNYVFLITGFCGEGSVLYSFINRKSMRCVKKEIVFKYKRMIF